MSDPRSGVFVMRLGDRLVRVQAEDIGPASTRDEAIADLVAAIERLAEQLRDFQAERLADKLADAPIASHYLH